MDKKEVIEKTVGKMRKKLSEKSPEKWLKNGHGNLG